MRPYGESGPVRPVFLRAGWKLKKEATMPDIPTLVGIEGHVEGEEMKLEYGKTIVVGRSRSADLSLRRMNAITSMSDVQRDADSDLRTVSGRHFEITMYNISSIEIVNLSPNGTYVDGKLADKIILDDVADKTHDIRMGTKEIFRLETKSYDED
jgi:hypothetical protein